MLLLEIGYSEKQDTFTGYVCRQSEYFSFEINRETVELSPLGQSFDTYEHFVDEFSKSNPHARFLTDPIEIKDLNYKDLERYKRLSLATRNRHGVTPSSNVKKLLFILAALCLAVGGYTIGREYYTQNLQEKITAPFKTATEPEIIQYYYEIHLSRGGLVDGFDLKQNKEQILITNRKGLDVTIDLSSIQCIEKVAVTNPLTRNVIYGSKQ